LTFVAAIVIGVVDNLMTPINSLTNYRDMTPFVLAVVALLFFARGRQYSFARGGIR
jgi:branched-chain amino acid transport system permease protein